MGNSVASSALAIDVNGSGEYTSWLVHRNAGGIGFAAALALYSCRSTVLCIRTANQVLQVREVLERLELQCGKIRMESNSR